MFPSFYNKLSLKKLLEFSGQSLIMPFYHSLGGMEALPHIQHLYPIRSTDQFEHDLDFLCQHFQPISLETLIEIVKKNKPLPKNAFFLSFDDGLKEVFTIAAPILKKRKIPATIFLNSAFVDNKGLFFRYKASLLIEHYQNQSLSKNNLKELQQFLQPFGFPHKDFKSILLSINYHQQNTLDEIAKILGIDFNSFCKKQKPYLTTDQIQSLINDGFTFGGHSVDHPLYNEIGIENQLQQTSNSIAFLKQHFGITYKSFAFPFTDHGVKSAFFNQVKKENIADITFGCAGIKQQTFPFHFQRIPIEESTEPASVQIKKQLAQFLMKKVIGKHKVKYQ